MFALTTSTVCRCGAHVIITEPYPGTLEAKCSGCYDGTEDASAQASARGHGATEDEALSDWCQFARGWSRPFKTTQDDTRPFLSNR